MVSTRLLVGMIVGIVLSFFSVAFFTQWEILDQIQLYAGSNSLRAFSLLVGANFDFDIISYVISPSKTIFTFFCAQTLAWLFVGYISGSIAKGAKRGAMTCILVVVVSLLMWIVFSIVSGEDLLALFSGTQLIDTLGGILSAVLFGSLGGATGGIAAGKYEEWTG